MSGRGASGRGGPGAGSRGRGGKFKKFTRGGGKHFSRDLRPLDADGNEVSMWADGAEKRGSDDSEEDSDEEDSEEDSEDESDSAPAAGAAGNAELTREERKKAKADQKKAAIAKKKGAVQVGDMPSDSDEEEEEEDDDKGMPANPNHSKAARTMAAKANAPPKADDGVEAATAGVKKMAMSRKERESVEAQQAKERYRKLHEAGKTDEAKADLARLKLIREKREAEAARKQAEKEEQEELAKAKRTEIEAREAKKREAALGKSGKKSKK